MKVNPTTSINAPVDWLIIVLIKNKAQNPTGASKGLPGKSVMLKVRVQVKEQIKMQVKYRNLNSHSQISSYGLYVVHVVHHKTFTAPSFYFDCRRA